VVDPAIPPDKRTRRQLCRHHGGIALSVLLQPTFDDLDIGREGLIAICGRDGILRARSALNEKTIGRDMSDTAPFRAAMTTPQGFVRSISPVDGVQRLLSFRSVAGYPLIVVAGFEETEFLAESVALRPLRCRRGRGDGDAVDRSAAGDRAGARARPRARNRRTCQPDEKRFPRDDQP
jgi:hypothetical protein